MNRRTILLLIAFLVMIMPVLGFPQGFKDFFYSASGFVIILIFYFIPRYFRQRANTKPVNRGPEPEIGPDNR